MSKYVVFYYLDSNYNYVYVKAESLKGASATAGAFSRKSGAVIIGIYPAYLLSNWHHE